VDEGSPVIGLAGSIQPVSGVHRAHRTEENTMSRLPLIVLSMGALLTTASVAHAGAVVSNNQKETRKGANYYAGNAALDGKDETAWLLPGDSENIGEYIIIDVPRINIDKLQMKAGWHRDEDTFKDYARVKKVSIEASYYNNGMELVPAPKVVEAEFQDEMGWQMIDLDDIVVEDATNGGKLKITILEVYPGKDFPRPPWATSSCTSPSSTPCRRSRAHPRKMRAPSSTCKTTTRAPAGSPPPTTPASA
jgi:hypothetical protein